MTTTSRRRLRIAGAGGLGTLLIIAALIFFDREPATPAAAPQGAAVAPVAPEQAPPKAQAQPLQPIAVTKSERQDYIVQAKDFADLIRKSTREPVVDEPARAIQSRRAARG